MIEANTNQLWGPCVLRAHHLPQPAEGPTATPIQNCTKWPNMTKVSRPKSATGPTREKTFECSAVQCSAVQCSAVQCSAQCSFARLAAWNATIVTRLLTSYVGLFTPAGPSPSPCPPWGTWCPPSAGVSLLGWYPGGRGPLVYACDNRNIFSPAQHIS
jgi:hypothetical protein